MSTPQAGNHTVLAKIGLGGDTRPENVGEGPPDVGERLRPEGVYDGGSDVGANADGELRECDIDLAFVDEHAAGGAPPRGVEPEVDGIAQVERRQAENQGTGSATASSWKRSLVLVDRREGLKVHGGTASNVSLYLMNHPAFAGRLAFNEFDGRTTWTGKGGPEVVGLPEILGGEVRDEHCVILQAALSAAAQTEFTLAAIHAGLDAAATGNSFHPVRAYLDGLTWDHTQRLDAMLHCCFGAETDDEYTRAVGARWMIQAVARIYAPGCQADSTLVLDGAQGLGKSMGLKALVPRPEWFSDSLGGSDVGGKDAMDSLRGRWIVELGEVEAVRRNRIETLKRFLTACQDTFRPAYGRRSLQFPRQCVFAGTANEAEWLVDPTGNRRFWPVAVVRPVDVEAIELNRDQLWAEAVVRYHAREPWHFDSERDARLINRAAEEQERRTSDDPWTRAVLVWLEERAPKQLEQSGIALEDVLERPLHFAGKNIQRLMRRDQMRTSQILARLGWRKRRDPVSRTPRRHRWYPPEGWGAE